MVDIMDEKSLYFDKYHYTGVFYIADHESRKNSIFNLIVVAIESQVQNNFHGRPQRQDWSLGFAQI